MSMGSITGVGAGFQSALNLKQDILTEYTYGTLPSAASNSGLHVWVTDVGINGGSEWVSDGVDWYPVGGEVILFRYGRFRQITGGGTISTGSSNTITHSTSWSGAAAGNQPHFLDLYLPAIATTPAITAGWYTVETTGDSTGTILSAGPGSAPITFTVGTTFSVVTTRQTYHEFNIPAGLLSEGSILTTNTNLTMAATTNSRTAYISLGGVDVTTCPYVSATYVHISGWSNNIVSTGLTSQFSSSKDYPSQYSVGWGRTNVDTSVQVAYKFEGVRTASNRLITSDFEVRFKK